MTTTHIEGQYTRGRRNNRTMFYCLLRANECHTAARRMRRALLKPPSYQSIHRKGSSVQAEIEKRGCYSKRHKTRVRSKNCQDGSRQNKGPQQIHKPHASPTTPYNRAFEKSKGRNNLKLKRMDPPGAQYKDPPPPRRYY